MTATGATLPGSAITALEAPWSDNDWTSPTAIYGAGEANITAASYDTGDQSYVLKAYNFNFAAIPDGATINGVTCIINARYANGAGALDLVQLLDVSRAKVGTNKASGTVAVTTSAANYTFGGTGDTWGNSLTAAWVKDADFGVAIGFIATAENCDAYIDSVTLNIEYTAVVTDDLTAAGITTGAPILGAATLGQKHNLSAAGIATAAPVLDAPTAGVPATGAVTRTGDVITIQSSAQSSSQSITVPADAEICVVAVALFVNSSNWMPANPITLAGSNLTTVQKTDEQVACGHMWIGYITSPSTGTQTLAWNWGTTLAEGAHICCVFYKGIDADTPIKSSGQELTAGADLTGLTASSGDMMVGGVYRYANDTITVTDSDQTELWVGGYFNLCIGAFAQKDGGTGFYYTGNSYNTVVALVIGAGAAGTTDDLTAAGITTGAPTLGAATIGQKHALASAAITTGAPVLAAPTFAQKQALSADGIATAAPTLGTPTVAEAHNLAADGIVTGAPVLDAPTIGQKHAITAAGITTAAPVLGAATVGQLHALAAAGIATAAPVLGAPTITAGADALTAAGITTGAPSVGAPAIGQKHALSAAGIATGAVSVATADIGQIHHIGAETIVTGVPGVASAILGQLHALNSPGVTTGAPVLDASTIAQTHNLGGYEIVTAAPAFEAPTLTETVIGVNALTAAGIATGIPVLDAPECYVISYNRSPRKADRPRSVIGGGRVVVWRKGR